MNIKLFNILTERRWDQFGKSLKMILRNGCGIGKYSFKTASIIRREELV